jgi:acetate kinase
LGLAGPARHVRAAPRILVVNAGSSSLKLQVLEGVGEGVGEAVGEGFVAGRGAHVEGWDGHDVAPIAALLDDAGPVDAVGHRVVHGGPDMQGPVLVDDRVRDRIAGLVALAPLHQPRSVAGIDAARRAVPGVAHVACFDTAYHATIPAAAATYALPAAWRERWPEARRFGFHGLSHAHAARRAAELLDRPGGGEPLAPLRVVSCHLGAGASLCASLTGRSVDGRSVDTTMGFTPLEGLVMATRSGSVDPGLVLWLLTEGGLTAEAVSDGLHHDAGLQGLAGTPDMRAIVERVATGGDPAARLALDVYVHRLVGLVAAMVASLGGVDALVFTGGVGEHAPVVRAEAAGRLGFLGVVLDAARNEAATGGDAVIGPPGGRLPATLVVEAREDLEIARQTAGALR